MNRLVFIIMILGITLFLSAGVSDGYYQNPDFKLSGLFNPDNFKMNHSLTFSSGFSSTGNGYYSNTYTNHITFNLRKNLDFKLNINFVNAGSMFFNQDYDLNWNDDNASHIVPEFQLEWRPSDNTTLRIEFEQRRFSPWSNDLFSDDDPFAND